VHMRNKDGFMRSSLLLCKDLLHVFYKKKSLQENVAQMVKIGSVSKIQCFYWPKINISSPLN